VSELKTRAFLIFGVHFFFNLIWSYVFFGIHQIGWAFIIILLMILTLGIVIFYFRKINVVSTYLLVPYLVWISFASILNGTIWKLNQ
jgi:translocator protein